MNNWTDLEHQSWRQLKELGLSEHNNFVLAISGGLDSMVLLEVFARVKPAAQLKVAYFHHGSCMSDSQKSHRDRAQELVQKKVFSLNKHNITFHTSRSETQLESEEEFRRARWEFLRGLKAANDVLVTAHHLDDHFETLLLKLLRGTALDGFTAFKMWNHDVFRPLLQHTKVELAAYAAERELTWEEDPSNGESHYLRNWVRDVWLKGLDEKIEGGSKNLAKSLMRVVQAADLSGSFELVFEPQGEEKALGRIWYMSLIKANQLRALSLFLKRRQIFDFTGGHLDEIRKRLDKNQKDITFELLGRKWVINASQIMLE